MPIGMQGRRWLRQAGAARGRRLKLPENRELTGMQSLWTAEQSARLRELQACRILDMPSDPALDDLVRLASHFCNVPIVLISFAEESSAQVMAAVGTSLAAIPLTSAFLQNPGQMLIVADTHR